MVSTLTYLFQPTYSTARRDVRDADASSTSRVQSLLIPPKDPHLPCSLEMAVREKSNRQIDAMMDMVEAMLSGGGEIFTDSVEVELSRETFTINTTNTIYKKATIKVVHWLTTTKSGNTSSNAERTVSARSWRETAKVVRRRQNFGTRRNRLCVSKMPYKLSPGSRAIIQIR